MITKQSNNLHITSIVEEGAEHTFSAINSPDVLSPYSPITPFKNVPVKVKDNRRTFTVEDMVHMLKYNGYNLKPNLDDAEDVKKSC